MRKSQVMAAQGKVFDAVGVIPGTSRVRFIGIWPSGNVAVKRAIDPDTFGPITVTPEAAKPLFDAIEKAYPDK